MSLEFIGLIAPQETSEALAPRGPIVDTDFIKAFAQAHEYGGFDQVLLAVSTTDGDSLVVASYAAALTNKLGLLVAHRPGFQAPTFSARQFATLDHLSGGRVSMNVITGADSGDLQRDGDFLEKDRRYARTDEYLDVVKQAWTSDKPFDHQGAHYHVQDYKPVVKSVQKPHIPIYFAGASDAAVEVAAKHADVYMMWGEPLDDIRQRIARVREAAARYGREDQIRFSLSLRPILGATEEQAWAKAEQILQDTKVLLDQRKRQRSVGRSNSGSDRLLDFAKKQKVHDTRLWMELAELTGAAGNSTSLVGTPDQVAAAAVEYYNLGVTTFLFRGFDLLRDAVEYGQDLLPRIRQLVEQQGRNNVSSL
jgi:alkanesulfonate monooxygenase